jgi:hypothetical protein
MLCFVHPAICNVSAVWIQQAPFPVQCNKPAVQRNKPALNEHPSRLPRRSKIPNTPITVSQPDCPLRQVGFSAATRRQYYNNRFFGTLRLTLGVLFIYRLISYRLIFHFDSYFERLPSATQLTLNTLADACWRTIVAGLNISMSIAAKDDVFKARYIADCCAYLLYWIFFLLSIYWPDL